MQNHWCDLLSNLTGLVNMIQNSQHWYFHSSVTHEVIILSGVTSG